MSTFSSINQSFFRLCLKWWLDVTLLGLALITLLSLIPLPQLPEVPGSDKTHHVLAYALLMLPAFLVQARKRYLLLVLFLAWSGVIELVQPLVNRYGEWPDLAANFAGLICGAIVGVCIGRVLVFTDNENREGEL